VKTTHIRAYRFASASRSVSRTCSVVTGSPPAPPSAEMRRPRVQLSASRPDSWVDQFEDP
jgi:hypothetical protein